MAWQSESFVLVITISISKAHKTEQRQFFVKEHTAYR